MRRVAAPFVFIGLAALPPVAHADIEGLAERWAPVYRYDAKERDHAIAVEAFQSAQRPPDLPKVASNAPPPVYTHGVFRDDGSYWLQYWSFHAYNGQDRGVVTTGRHEGDWELVQLRFDRRGKPKQAIYLQHSWAEACPWSVVEQEGGRPVVYVANGSHAAYFRRGVHGRPWPDPNDEARGDGRRVAPRATPIYGALGYGGDPEWTRWPGQWGTSRASWVPAEQSSPRGPYFQPRSAPAALTARARPCGSGAPARPLALTGTLAALIALFVGGLAVGAHRLAGRIRAS